MPLVTQPLSWSGSGRDVNTTRCCMSLQVRLELASKAKAQIPAANGAEADVPVWSEVHRNSGRSEPSISTVAMDRSTSGRPELYVVARVDEHSSRYQGLNLFLNIHKNTCRNPEPTGIPNNRLNKTYPPCVALDIDRVNIELVYPSQLHESSCRPPLPEAHTKMDPLPFRPCFV